MLLKYFYDDNLAQASYMVACPGSGEAMVIDPSRDITPYLQEAERRGYKIIAVTETHIHADYISGGHELAAHTGATLYLSSYGGELGYKFAHDDVKIHYVEDGERIMIGNVALDVMHTPGHTPEHIMLMVTDNNADRPLGIFSGDCLFVGDIGRPDLLETAAGVANSKEHGARDQFANIQRLKAMADYLQVWPGHGAGSACGKSLGDLPSTTLGYEKIFNPAFQINDENAFVEWLLDGQPLTPAYFAQMKRVNPRGAALLNTLEQPNPLKSANEVNAFEVLVIDTRERQAFSKGHLPGSVNIPTSSSQFAAYVGWYVDYEQPVYLVLDERQLEDTLSRLRAIGVDKVGGYLTVEQVENCGGTVQQVDVQQAREMQKNGALVVDVRAYSERHDDFISGSKHVHMGEIPQRYHELPRDVQLLIQCGSGVRSQVVTTYLKRLGFENVNNLDGGIDAWKKAGLPITRNA